MMVANKMRTQASQTSEACETSEVSNGFKETEIGPIPADWEVVRLGNLCQPARTNVDPQELPEMPYVGLQHIDSGEPKLRRWGGSNEVRSSKNYFVSGDVLYGKLRPYLDKAVLAEFEGVCSTDILVFKVNPDFTLPEFLVYLLHTRQLLSHAITTTTGTNLPRTRWTSLRDFKLALPPLPEQRRIAHVLSTIQRAIAAQDKLIAAARELRRSLMQRLFTYGPGPEPAPTKETEIGEMPEHWEVVPLIDVVERTKQREPRKAPEASFQYIDVSSVSNKMFQIKSYTEYRGAEAPSRARRVVKSGDVIFATVRPYLKRIAVVPDHLDDQICSTAFCVIRARRDLADHKFIFYLMLSDDFVNRVSEHQRGSSYPAVSNTDVLNQSVPLPTLDEQREVACILSSADRKIETEEQRKAALQALFKSMLHQLMTGQVRLRDVESEG